MAIGWLAVLKLVPWGDVISNAPKVAEGAKKLWNTVAKNSPPPDIAAASAQPTAPEAQSIATLQARLTAAESDVSKLHHQMLASSELIQALADQNAQLIKRVDVNRRRVVWLAFAVVTLGICVALILANTLTR